MAVRSSVLLLYPVGFAIAHVHFGELKSFRTSVCSLELCGYLLFFSVFWIIWNEALRLRSLKQVVKSCRDSVCKLEFFGCPVFSSASVPCGICNCACSLRQTEVFSDFSLLVRTVRLPTFLLFFGLCRNEALWLRSLKQIVKFCRASVCKLELWLSGPQFCFYTLWDLQLRLFTSAN